MLCNTAGRAHTLKVPTNAGGVKAPVRPIRGPSRARVGSRVPTRAIDVNLLASLGEAGDVQAPIGLAVGIGVVVAIAGTALVPILLKPGDDAAKEVFDTKQDNPLNKKK